MALTKIAITSRVVAIEAVTKAVATIKTTMVAIVASEAMGVEDVVATIISNLSCSINFQAIEAVEIGAEEATMAKICTTTIIMLAISKTSLASR